MKDSITDGIKYTVSHSQRTNVAVRCLRLQILPSPPNWKHNRVLLNNLKFSK